MTLAETLWYAPFASGSVALQSPVAPSSDDDSARIKDAQPFTVSLESVKLASEHPEPRVQSIIERVLGASHDVLILSTTALGAQPPIDRVHVYRADVDLRQPHAFRDFLADTMCVCDDYEYAKQDPLYIELKVVTVDTLAEHRDAAVKTFEELAGKTGAAYPVAVPYIAAGEALIQAVDKVWDNLRRDDVWRISEQIKLSPPNTQDAKTIRSGRYVVFSEPIDASQFHLSAGGEVEELEDEHKLRPHLPHVRRLSYGVFRVDPTKAPLLSFVISQRVATLLTQLKNDEQGKPVGPLETSFGFLTDTLRAYTNFTDLQRYQHLQQKKQQTGLTKEEQQQMADIASRPDLQPFLPTGAAPAP
jgi:hypothetical protein